jgi:hypothetical protein
LRAGNGTNGSCDLGIPRIGIKPAGDACLTIAAIEETLEGLSTTHADQLKRLMSLSFQQFEDVWLMAA